MVPPAPTPAPVASVVAWHNRHPLALRITAAQVRSPGWVSLPVVLRQGAAWATAESDSADGAVSGQTLRERAMARAHNAPQPQAAPPAVASPPDLAGAEAAFSEELLPPHRARELARFACRHGSSGELGASAQPRREATIDPRLVPDGRAVAWLHLQTAAIEVGERRARVLIGSGAPVAVLGKRLLSRARLGAALGGVLALLAALALWLVPGALPGGVFSGRAAGVSTPAADMAKAPAGVASATVVPSVAAPPAAPAASLPAAVASAVPTAQAPATAPAPEPHVASKPLPTPLAEPPAAPASSSIRPRLDPELAKAARREAQALRAASAAGLAAPAASAQRPADIQAQPGATGAAFALVARTTKSRAAAAVLLGAMAGEAGRNGAAPRAEVLAAEGGYRASLWPFGSREQALRVQQRLREAGLATELVSF